MSNFYRDLTQRNLMKLQIALLGEGFIELQIDLFQNLQKATGVSEIVVKFLKNLTFLFIYIGMNTMRLGHQDTVSNALPDFSTALERSIYENVHIRDLFLKLAENSNEFLISDYAAD